MRSVNCDIAIVGLGPAGAAAAKAAAQSGLSVVAIDRKQRAGEPVQCAELVPALFAHHAPLGPAIAQPIAAMHTYVEARPKHVQPCFPGHIISRTRFDSDLVAQAQDAGAGVILGQRVTCIRRDGMIGLSDGREIFAAVIIAADGPRSLIGAAAGRTNAALIETRQITVPLRAPHDATDIFLSADIPGGYGWLFPKRDTAHVGVGVDAAFRTRLKPLLERLRSKLLDEARIGAEVLAITGGAIPAGGILDPVAAIGGRPVLLAGDAAGLANPVTGAG
ncbi:MAG: NAD(P)/FAD-dependent oxidoreductase, partial [Hyphomonadaceae bacterium]